MSTPTISDAPASATATGQDIPSREELIAALASCTTTAPQELPSHGELIALMAARTKWWVPVVDFGLLLNALPQKIRARVNAIFAKLIQDKFAPETATEARQQLRELLQAEYPEVMEKVNEAFFVKHEALFAEIHRQMQRVGPLQVGRAGGEEGIQPLSDSP
ncbi:hypothetical protein N657DRAFT_686977 [Parathielavia appendiculata]|uniref:Uncharacterized protein n=1 Tax=Parathielavia appendiculata TaxID=2587402 RepID=A0AAN6UBN6_9PEZI|nr:hypothetical protein N657DRAFT_686977 [Parathielavia appendiculata]